MYHPKKNIDTLLEDSRAPSPSTFEAYDRFLSADLPVQAPKPLKRSEAFHMNLNKALNSEVQKKLLAVSEEKSADSAHFLPEDRVSSPTPHHTPELRPFKPICHSFSAPQLSPLDIGAATPSPTYNMLGS